MEIELRNIERRQHLVQDYQKRSAADLKNAVEGKSNRPFCMYCDCGSDVRCGGRYGFLKGSSGTVEGGGINGVPPLPWF